MHRLFIVRHAKSAPSSPATADHDRPLAAKGAAALGRLSVAVGSHLEGRPLDVVLCSTATRARQTVAAVAALVPAVAAAAVRTERRLYLADLDRLLALLMELSDDVHTVLVCGHNPGLHRLALTLVGQDAVPPALAHDLPTAGLVVVDLEPPWTSIGADTATLRAFVGTASE